MCHALIIEDEALIAFEIGDLVEEAGVSSVAFAQTELEAVSAAMEHKPDIIVSDVNLLTGTGRAAVTSIKHRLGHIPVIFVTANPDGVDGVAYEALLPKPFTGAHLKSEVARIATASSTG